MAKQEAICGCELAARGRKAVAVGPQIKSSNLKRLRRIEGQIRGLEKMVEQDRYCPEILVQVSAVQEALRAVGRTLMSNHLRHCVTQEVRKGSPKGAEAIFGELLDLIYTHSR